MNLSKLFEMQRQLDEKILERFPHLRNEDLLPKKILALQVELGELCNCWRGFKFWSEDQVPRTRVLVNRTTDDIGFKYIGPEHIKNPLLEEYVDVVHFTLSVGLEIEIKHEIFPEPINYGDAVIQFNELFGQISYFASVLNRENEWEEVENEYERIWSLLFGLAGLLGFTWEQIEQAYFQKNKINHQRQEEGY